MHPDSETAVCSKCQPLLGAGGGKPPPSHLQPIAKYRIKPARTSTTLDFRCAACNTEWRYHRMAGWDRLGI
jgi:hypothetical protein